MDEYGNQILCGHSNLAPFATSAAVYQAYIALIDQRGNPYWIYSGKNVISTTNSYCQKVAYKNGYIYAAVVANTMNSTSTLL